jgi:hypothetical protein
LQRLIFAIRAFFSLLFKGTIAEDIALALGYLKRGAPRPSAAAPAAAAAPDDSAIRLLALLQQEARLVDFLYEDISAFSDEQVGAAVRDVHAKARQALDRHVRLVPIVDGVEGATTPLTEAGYDPKDRHSFKLLGNVPPDGGVDSAVLRHRGWKVENLDLPPLAPGNKRVVAPAEFEVE